MERERERVGREKVEKWQRNWRVEIKGVSPTFDSILNAFLQVAGCAPGI